MDDPVCGDALRASGTSIKKTEVKIHEDWVIRRKPVAGTGELDSSETIRVGTAMSKI